MKQELVQDKKISILLKKYGHIIWADTFFLCVVESAWDIGAAGICLIAGYFAEPNYQLADAKKDPQNSSDRYCYPHCIFDIGSRSVFLLFAARKF